MVEGCRAYGGDFLNHGARRWAVFSFAEMLRKLQGGFCELKTLLAALRLYSTRPLFCPQLRLYSKPGRYVEEARQKDEQQQSWLLDSLLLFIVCKPWQYHHIPGGAGTLCPPRCGPHGRTSGLKAA